MTVKCKILHCYKTLATDTAQNTVKTYPGTLMDQNNFQLLFSPPVKFQLAQVRLGWSHISCDESNNICLDCTLKPSQNQVSLFFETDGLLQYLLQIHSFLY